MQDDERMEGRLDGLIDAALRSYGEPGEIPEARVVLARVRERAEAERRRRARWWIGAAGLAAACAVILVILGLVVMRGPRKAEIARVPQVIESPHPARANDTRGKDGAPGVVMVGEGSHPARAKGARGKGGAPGERLPKLEVFPTPMPLSAEERALVAFAQRGPLKVQRAVLDDEKHWDDPIILASVQEEALPSGKPQDR